MEDGLYEILMQNKEQKNNLKKKKTEENVSYLYPLKNINYLLIFLIKNQSFY